MNYLQFVSGSVTQDRVLKYFLENDEPVSNRVFADKTGMPAANTHRYLARLVKAGLLDKRFVNVKGHRVACYQKSTTITAKCFWTAIDMLEELEPPRNSAL